MKSTPDAASSRRRQAALLRIQTDEEEPADETQVEYWQMEAEVYAAELRSHPASRAQKVTGYRTSREAGDSGYQPSETWEAEEQEAPISR